MLFKGYYHNPKISIILLGTHNDQDESVHEVSEEDINTFMQTYCLDYNIELSTCIGDDLRCMQTFQTAVAMLGSNLKYEEIQ